MKRIFLPAALAGLLFCNHMQAQDKLYQNQFPLSDVVLLDGPFKQARDLNINTLLQYKVDRLLAPFRKEAGLAPKDSSYKNWDGLDGHVGGHYLAALAMNYASTGNAECKRRMDYMVAELKACQEANATNGADWGVGYVGGVPNSKVVWPALKSGDLQPYRAAWVPWYNVHKMFAGLRDAWLYGRSEEAKSVFLKFCDWATNITSPLTDEQMQSMLDTEHGGMNEVLANLKLANPIPVELQPFYQIHDARYMMYWMALSNGQYRSYMDSLSTVEKEKLALEKRTVDFVAPGEQQPEVDHAMQSDKSRKGSAQDQFFREAASGGYFSYNMATAAETDLRLLVRYWGAEWGSRRFDIYIDNQKLVTEDNTGKWNQSKFINVEYAIPATMIKGKDHIRVKFAASPGASAGPVYYLRLVKAKGS